MVEFARLQARVRVLSPAVELDSGPEKGVARCCSRDRGAAAFAGEVAVLPSLSGDWLCLLVSAAGCKHPLSLFVVARRRTPLRVRRRAAWCAWIQVGRGEARLFPPGDGR